MVLSSAAFAVARRRLLRAAAAAAGTAVAAMTIPWPARAAESTDAPTAAPIPLPPPPPVEPSAKGPPGYEDLDVPFVTTPDNVVLAMLEMAGVHAGDRLIDLGSGDGRIVITAAHRFGIPATGVEIDPTLVARSIENARRAGVQQHVRFVEQDLFQTDLTQATVITMYLLPDVNIRLRPRLLELAPGTRLVSHDWTMGDWTPDRTEVVDAPQKKLGLRKIATLMRWTVPANVGGRHRAPSLDLSVEQRYQRITGGQLLLDGRRYRIEPVEVAGDRVELVASDGAAQVRLQARLVAQPHAGDPIRWQVRSGAGGASEVVTRRE